MRYAFCQKLLVLPRGFFTPNDNHFLYVRGVISFPLMGKLIHLTSRKNTIQFSHIIPLPRLESTVPHEKHGGFHMCGVCDNDVERVYFPLSVAFLLLPNRIHNQTNNHLFSLDTDSAIMTIKVTV